MSAYYGVIYIKRISTRTSRRGVAYLPIISQMNGVFEFSFIWSKFTSLTGMTVSQLHTPFSAARLQLSWFVREGHSSLSGSSRRRASLSLRLHCCSALVAWSAPLSVTSGSVIAVEASYSEAAIWHGFVFPRPPILTGDSNKSRSAGVQVCPLIVGIRAWLMARPRSSKRSSISDIVLR